MRESLNIDISTARFANVAFSDGSLLHGFNQRIQKRQPISAPKDIRRYFVTPKEAGELCLLAQYLGENRDILLSLNLVKNLHPNHHLRIWLKDISTNLEMSQISVKVEEEGLEAFL